jgi:hypothetical protein
MQINLSIVLAPLSRIVHPPLMIAEMPNTHFFSRFLNISRLFLLFLVSRFFLCLVFVSVGWLFVVGWMPSYWMPDRKTQRQRTTTGPSASWWGVGV